MALVGERPADGKRISGFGARDPRIRFAKQSVGHRLGKIVMKFSCKLIYNVGNELASRL